MDDGAGRPLTLEGTCSRCGNTFRRMFSGFRDLVVFAESAQEVPVLCDECLPQELVRSPDVAGRRKEDGPGRI